MGPPLEAEESREHLRENSHWGNRTLWIHDTHLASADYTPVMCTS